MHRHLQEVLKQKGSDVFSVEPSATVIEAVRRMNEKRIGAVLVMAPNRNKPVGIFTERDVLRRVVDAGRDPQTTLVRDVMTDTLITVPPERTVEEAMAIITEKRCRHLPVVDGDRLLGMVSSGDLTRWVTRSQKIHITDLVDYITGSYPVGPA